MATIDFSTALTGIYHYRLSQILTSLTEQLNGIHHVYMVVRNELNITAHSYAHPPLQLELLKEKLQVQHFHISTLICYYAKLNKMFFYAHQFLYK